MRAAILVVAAASSGAALAQSCPRPMPPPGGHPTTVELFVPVVYSDQYQTMGSMVLPTVPPPTCGWPLVVFVHPFGQTRGFDLDLQTSIAGQGYAVWSYDVRAQGQAQLANVGHAHEGSTFWGPIERYDLAEQITFAAQTTWTGIVDTTRTAVVGSSQGGAHAWIAAMFSGQPLTAPDRPGITFPTIACVVAADLGVGMTDDWLRGGAMFSSWFVEAIAGNYTGVPFDTTFVQTCRAAFLAQDHGALAAIFAAEQRDPGTLLSSSTVPVLHSHAYHDNIGGPLTGIVAGETRTAPHRVLLSTIGHGTPPNLLERSSRDATIQRWLHRWLWGELNEVDLEARTQLAELPLTQVERDDLSLQWSHAHAATTTTPIEATRLFLHDDFELREAPAAPQTETVLAQTIDPTVTDFTPADYLGSPAMRTVPEVLLRCPLQERTWSWVVPAESQLVRSATASLRLVPQHAHWQLAVLLTVEAPGTAEEVMLAQHAIARTDSVPGVAEDHPVRLAPVAVRLPAGAIVRLRLRNLWLRSPPLVQTLETSPVFHDFRVDVVHGPGAGGSALHLPLEAVAPRLVVDRTTVELATPVPIVATVRGGSARAGYPYFATVGMSGQLPSVPFLDDVIPVEADWLVLMSAGAEQPPYFSGFLGFLDTAGNANVTLDLSTAAPLPQLLNGYALTFAAFVWDGPWAPTGAASPPCDVLLR